MLFPLYILYIYICGGCSTHKATSNHNPVISKEPLSSPIHYHYLPINYPTGARISIGVYRGGGVNTKILSIFPRAKHTRSPPRGKITPSVISAHIERNVYIHSLNLSFRSPRGKYENRSSFCIFLFFEEKSISAEQTNTRLYTDTQERRVLI